MRYTEYHAGVAVIRDKKLLPGAMAKLATLEDQEEHTLKISFSDTATLQVKLTEKMKEDYADCQIKSCIAGGDGKDCTTCSLNTDVLGQALCELPVVVDRLI